MPETATATRPTTTRAATTRRSTLGLPAKLILVVAMLALLVIPLVMHGMNADFAGTDGIGTEIISERGVEPWFHPLFVPQSAELQSGLFAIQAALGAGILGFALGNLNARRRQQLSAASGPTEQTRTA